MTYNFYSPASPVRQHVLNLQAKGLGYRRIAKLANVSEVTVRTLLKGHTNYLGRETEKITTGAALRLLNVTFSYDQLADRALVPAKGAVRRIQALAVQGWSLRYQSEWLGFAQQNMLHLLKKERITKALNERVKVLFNEHCNLQRSSDDRRELQSITRAKNHAKKNGWLSHMVWDDIDNDETPIQTETDADLVDWLKLDLLTDGKQVKCTIKERLLFAPLLSKQGMHHPEIAALMLVSVQTILRDARSWSIE